MACPSARAAAGQLLASSFRSRLVSTEDLLVITMGPQASRDLQGASSADFYTVSLHRDHACAARRKDVRNRHPCANRIPRRCDAAPVAGSRWSLK